MRLTLAILGPSKIAPSPRRQTKQPNLRQMGRDALTLTTTKEITLSRRMGHFQMASNGKRPPYQVTFPVVGQINPTDEKRQRALLPALSTSDPSSLG